MNPPKENVLTAYKQRTKDFFAKGIKYNLVLVIVGLLGFKSVIETSGLVIMIAEGLTAIGIPLIFLIMILGFAGSFFTGVHVASTGMVTPIILPMLPIGISTGPIAALLFTSVLMGYIMSPIHMCLILTKEYFKVGLPSVYKMLIFPVLAMLLTAVIQVMLLK
jgi:hypothetical protein